MSERPSPYDAGLGPVSNSSRKLNSSRPRRSLDRVPPCTGLTELIFWRRIGEGLQPPRERMVLCLTETGVFSGVKDHAGDWWHFPRSYAGKIPNVIAWAEWPEGPSTCNGDEDA